MGVTNAMENVVDVLLQRYLQEHPDAFNCTCKQCLEDIKALTLNKLKPKYYSNPSGNAFTHMESFTSQNQADIQVYLNNSIEIVNKNPRHS